MSRFRVLPRWVYLCIMFTHLHWWQHFLCVLSFCLLLHQLNYMFRNGSGSGSGRWGWQHLHQHEPSPCLIYYAVHTHIQCCEWPQRFCNACTSFSKKEFLTHENQKPETEMGFLNFFFLIWWVVQMDAGAQSKPLDSKTFVYHSPCYPFPDSSMWSSSSPSLGLLLFLQVVVVSNPSDLLINLSCDQS